MVFFKYFIITVIIKYLQQEVTSPFSNKYNIERVAKKKRDSDTSLA